MADLSAFLSALLSFNIPQRLCDSQQHIPRFPILLLATRSHQKILAFRMARTSQSLLMSMGTVNMWGFSPGFDMLHGVPGLKASSGQEPTKAASVATSSGAADSGADAEPIHILLVGPGDVRHVLAAVAHRRRYGESTRPLHIYIYEKSIETLARHFLLLQIAQDWQLPLRQRCNLFLEVFGNARVQVRVHPPFMRRSILALS